MKIRDILLETTSAPMVTRVKTIMIESIRESLFADIENEFELVKKLIGSHERTKVPSFASRGEFNDTSNIYNQLMEEAVRHGIMNGIGKSVQEIAGYYLKKWIRTREFSGTQSDVSMIYPIPNKNAFMGVSASTENIQFYVARKVYDSTHQALSDFLIKKLSIENDPLQFNLIKSPKKEGKPVYTPRMNIRTFTRRMKDAIVEFTDSLKTSNQLNRICTGVLHEIVHIQQSKKIKIEHTEVKNAIGRKFGEWGGDMGFNYYAAYNEIDAYANEFVAGLILNSGGLPLDYSDITKNIKTTSVYWQFSKSNAESHPEEHKKAIEKVYRKFMKVVVKNINEYNDIIASQGQQA